MKLNLYLKQVESILTNKYFIGIFMIIINIGSRFIIEELTPDQRKYINNKVIRRIFIFCVFFMATKDLCASLVLTLMFILFVSHLFTGNQSNDDDKVDTEKQKILEDVQMSLTKHLG